MDRAQQKEFRSRTAGFIWAMIEARRKMDPAFISEEDVQRWGANKDSLEDLSSPKILRQAARMYQEILRFPGQESIPGPSESGQADPVDLLIDLVPDFITGDLEQAAQEVRRGGI